jgi:hypothetical protein
MRVCAPSGVPKKGYRVDGSGRLNEEPVKVEGPAGIRPDTGGHCEHGGPVAMDRRTIMWRRTISKSLPAFALSSLFGCSAAPPGSDSEVVGTTESALTAGLGTGTLDVAFASCTEYAGFVPVPLANAARLVPSGFTVALAAPGEANAIVRVAHCASVVVAGRGTGAGTVAQLGVNIVSPDGTGDINNYTVWYDTDGAILFAALRQAGVNAAFDPLFFYSRQPKSDGTSAALVVANGFAPAPPFVIDSTVLIPTSATQAIDFKANWWQENGGATAKMASDFPNILFGPESTGVTIEVIPGTQLGNLIGAATGTFVGLSVSNVIPSATMHVAPATL